MAGCTGQSEKLKHYGGVSIFATVIGDFSSQVYFVVQHFVVIHIDFFLLNLNT